MYVINVFVIWLFIYNSIGFTNFQAMHICYLVTLFTVHVHGSTYVSFLNQFPLLLIDAFKKNDKLKQPILLILETLQIQAENISVHTRVLDVYQLSLAKLLKHERFQE